MSLLCLCLCGPGCPHDPGALPLHIHFDIRIRPETRSNLNSNDAQWGSPLTAWPSETNIVSSDIQTANGVIQLTDSMHAVPRATSTELKANGLNAFLALGRAGGQQAADALDQSPGVTLFVPQDSALSAVVQQLPREHLQWLIRAVSKYKQKKYRANSVIRRLRDEAEGQQQGQQQGQRGDQGRGQGRGQERGADVNEEQQFGPRPSDSQRYRQPRGRSQRRVRSRRSDFTVNGAGQDIDVESDRYESDRYEQRPAAELQEEGGELADVDESGQYSDSARGSGRGVAEPESDSDSQYRSRSQSQSSADRSGGEFLEAEGAVDQQRAGELAQALTQLRGQASFDLAQWCQQNGIAVQQQPQPQQPGGGGDQQQQSGLTPDLLIKLVQAHTFNGIIHVSRCGRGRGGDACLVRTNN